ncbi:MAG: hypothetical protein ISR55_07780 [Bacteroidetes bacterium]|nr:hypothetical protein [Bacteroidota bacterium]MBL6963707.1 hypothetical protein [Bacteroidota bacterium]
MVKCLLQAFLILIVTAAIMLLASIYQPDSDDWQIGSYGLYAFIIINPFLGLNSKNWANYTKDSCIILLALLIDMIIIAILISGIHLSSMSSKLIYFLPPVLLFPIVIFMCRMIRIHILRKD